MSVREFIPPARAAAPVCQKPIQGGGVRVMLVQLLGNRSGEKDGREEVVMGMEMRVRLCDDDDDDDDGGWEGDGNERGGNGGRTSTSRCGRSARSAKAGGA